MHGRRVRAALATGAAVALAACSPTSLGDTGTSELPVVTSPSTSAATSSRTAADDPVAAPAGQAEAGRAPSAASASGRNGAGTSAASRPAPATVTLALAGDANTAWTARRVLRDGVGPMATHLRAADVAVLTLETLVVPDDRGLVAEQKRFTFVTGPAFVDRLHEAGVDVVNGANNHTMDFRVEGMRRMLAMRPRVPVVGVGADLDEAARPWRTTVRGRQVVVFGANDVETDGLDWTARHRPGQLVIARKEGLERLLRDVRAERAKDPDAVVVAFLHWGQEPQTCQSARQEDLARSLAAAGADVVAGSHSHRLQPVTTMPGAGGRTTVVAYGLGNFVFNVSSPGKEQTGVLAVSVPGRGTPTTVWHPGRIVDGIPQPLHGRAAAEAQRVFAQGVSRCG